MPGTADLDETTTDENSLEISPLPELVKPAGDLILDPCRDMVPGLILAREAKNIPVVMAELGPLAAAVGSACLARELEQAG